MKLINNLLASLSPKAVLAKTHRGFIIEAIRGPGGRRLGDKNKKPVPMDGAVKCYLTRFKRPDGLNDWLMEKTHVELINALTIAISNGATVPPPIL